MENLPDPEATERFQTYETMKRRRIYSGGGPPSAKMALRTRRVSVGISLIVSILVFRLWSLQFLEGERYREQSIENYEQRVEIPSRRGRILDRNFNVLAEDIWNYNILLDKTNPTPEELSQILPRLSEITGHSDLRSRLARRTPDRKGRRLILRDIPFHTMVAVQERALELPGIVTERVPGRYYPRDDLAVHLLGYVREIDRARLERLRDRGYKLGDRIGDSGIEYTYEERLRGRDGLQIVQLDTFGRQRDVLRVESPPQPGQDIVLSLDMSLQKKAEEILGVSPGVITALDPRTGAVLALASSPRFNPNRYRKDYYRLINDPNSPLTHRAIAGLYEPGSVFKAFESFGFLEEGIVTENTKISCPGYFSLGGNTRWQCWKPDGHGPVDLVQALRISCNVFFYNRGLELGSVKMADWAQRFHLGMLSGIDLPYEKAEPFPSKATVRPWYPGDTVNTAIGQGNVLVTPLQIAVAMAAVANGGTLYEPHVAAGVITSSSPRLRIEPIPPKVRGVIEASPTTWKMIRRGLWEVVNTYNGTGRRCRIEGFTTMGKTGTAEKTPGEPHAWYVCFGPVDGDHVPEIVVLVMLEHGGHGGEAASPLVKEFLEFYLSGGSETIA